MIIGFLSGIFGCKTNKNSNRNNLNKEDSAIQNVKDKTVRQKIFGEITEFSYLDFEDLSTNKTYEKFEIGKLKIKSGKVVCADPLYRALGLPQNWEVEKGEYPVSIYIGLEGDFEGRVAYAELIFSQDEIESWELSLIDEKLLKGNFEKKLNGMYPVENGLSSFSDFETWRSYSDFVSKYQKRSEEANFYNDILEPLFKENKGIPKSSRGEDWINYQLDPGEGNLIMFGSGWGDGLYPRYVGFDKNRNAVKLITDFIQLNNKD